MTNSYPLRATLERLEVEAGKLWNERQENCAKYGADISMPTVEVPVDILCGLIRSRLAPMVDNYSPEQRRVCDYLISIMPEIGCGLDPIGFLIASHNTIRRRHVVPLLTELSKPQFLTVTTTGDPDPAKRKASVQFSWCGPDSFASAEAMHEALLAAAKGLQP